MRAASCSWEKKKTLESPGIPLLEYIYTTTTMMIIIIIIYRFCGVGFATVHKKVIVVVQKTRYRVIYTIWILCSAHTATAIIIIIVIINCATIVHTPTTIVKLYRFIATGEDVTIWLQEFKDEKRETFRARSRSDGVILHIHHGAALKSPRRYVL